MRMVCLWLLGMLGLLFTSCEHKELCYDHSHLAEVEVIFDWKNAPEADPESMRLYLFPVDGGEMIPFEFAGKQGGTFKIQPGRYRAICVNNDTESILYRHFDSYDSFEAYVTDAAMQLRSISLPRAEATAGQRAGNSPSLLYSDHLEEVEFFNKRGKQSFTMYPASMICHYTVEIRHVENREYLPEGNIFSTLSSMSGGWFMSQDQPTDEMVVLSFDLASAKDNSLFGDFYTFGYPAGSKELQQLVIYVIMSDGKKYYYTFDVTNQIHDAKDPKEVHIVIDTLPLPMPITNGSGFDLTVDDWETVYIDLPM